MAEPRCILLIVIDCLRADHVSCYGYDRPTTPTIDALAHQGVVWEQAHSVSSWTKPSVTSLLTGLYPAQHGAFQGVKRSKGRHTTTDILSPECPTLAEKLSAAGWRCGAFVNNAQLGEFTQLHRGFSSYLPAAGKADRLIGVFLEWLEEAPQRQNFAYLHFLEAHWPYKPRRRHVALFGGDRDTNHFRDFSARQYGRLRQEIAGKRATLSERQMTDMIQMYDGAVRRLDGKLKIILAMLSELGLRDETAIVITADHGEEFLEHGQIGHGHSLYDELLHVPLVARLPGGPAGVRIEKPVSQVDLAPTLLRYAGVHGEASGGELLCDNGAVRPVCAELRIRRRYSQTLRTLDWKLHRKYKFFATEGDTLAERSIRACVADVPHRIDYELYDIRNDRRERHDLAGDPAHAATREHLDRELDRWWQETAGGDDAAGEVAIDDQVVERLRDLGYID